MHVFLSWETKYITMRIKFKQMAVSAEHCYRVGGVYEFDDADAQRLIDAGFAVAADEKGKPEKVSGDKPVSSEKADAKTTSVKAVQPSSQKV